jgi:hypothetical protein
MNRWRALALASAGWLGACASSSSDAPVPTRVRPPTNAVVVSVTFIEAPPAAAAAAKPAVPGIPAAAGTTAPAPTRPSAAANTRNARQRTSQPGSRLPPTPATATAAKATDARPAVAPTAPRYTYGVQLDNGDYRDFGFAQDQGLTVGRRVLVNDSGLVVVTND